MSASVVEIAKKPKPICRRCKVPMERISRGLWVKSLLFWLPVKRYECPLCDRKRLKMRMG